MPAPRNAPAISYVDTYSNDITWLIGAEDRPSASELLELPIFASRRVPALERVYQGAPIDLTAGEACDSLEELRGIVAAEVELCSRHDE